MQMNSIFECITRKTLKNEMSIFSIGVFLQNRIFLIIHHTLMASTVFILQIHPWEIQQLENKIKWSYDNS